MWSTKPGLFEVVPSPKSQVNSVFGVFKLSVNRIVWPSHALSTDAEKETSGAAPTETVLVMESVHPYEFEANNSNFNARISLVFFSCYCY